MPEETAWFLPGPGIEMAEYNCASCHLADYVNTQPPEMGKEFWAKEVHKMIATYGAPVSEEDAVAITEYLAATY